MDEPPFALVCGWRYPLLIIAKGGSFSTVSTLRLYSPTSIACGSLYELEAALRAADGHLEMNAPEEAFGELRRAQVQVETLEWLSHRLV